MEIDHEEPEEMEMEETIVDIVEAATQEPSSPKEPTDEGIMGIRDEVEIVLQSSNFINEEREGGTPARGLASDVVSQETTSPAQEDMNIEMGRGVTQESPPTQSKLEDREEMTCKVNTAPQEPVSTVGKEEMHEG